MKKLVGFLGAVGLALLLIVGGSLYSSATTSASESDAELAASKTVTQTKYYGINDQIKQEIYYNVGGWKGTLKLVGTQSTGTIIIAHYRGTVNCSEPCPVNVDADS